MDESAEIEALTMLALEPPHWNFNDLFRVGVLEVEDDLFDLNLTFSSHKSLDKLAFVMKQICLHAREKRFKLILLDKVYPQREQASTTLLS